MVFRGVGGIVVGRNGSGVGGIIDIDGRGDGGVVSNAVGAFLAAKAKSSGMQRPARQGSHSQVSEEREGILLSNKATSSSPPSAHPPCTT